MLETFLANRQLIQTLREMSQNRRLPHAILLEGEPGSGKRTVARALAQAVLCTGQTPPCGLCTGCKKAQRGVHPDWITVGESCTAPLSFHIETIRQIRETIQIAPNEGEKKIYLLQNAQNMTVSAQNALLKILEEPPAHGMFLLLCENRSSLLETVVSRCAVFSLQPPTPSQCFSYLTQQLPQEPPEHLRQLAEEAGGNIGKAMALAAQPEDGPGPQARQLLTHILQDDEFQLAAYLTRYDRKKDQLLAVLPLLKELCKEMAAEKFSKHSENSFTKQHSSRLSALQWVKIIDIIEDTAELLGQNVNLTLILAGLSAKIKAIT